VVFLCSTAFNCKEYNWAGSQKDQGQLKRSRGSHEDQGQLHRARGS